MAIQRREFFQRLSAGFIAALGIAQSPVKPVQSSGWTVSGVPLKTGDILTVHGGPYPYGPDPFVGYMSTQHSQQFEVTATMTSTRTIYG